MFQKYAAHIILIITFITFVQLFYFIGSGDESYPGITYPTFSQQYNFLPTLRRRYLPAFCNSQETITTYFVSDYCEGIYVNPKYRGLYPFIWITPTGGTSLRVDIKDVFPFINTYYEQSFMKNRLNQFGDIYHTIPENDMNIFFLMLEGAVEKKYHQKILRPYRIDFKWFLDHHKIAQTSFSSYEINNKN